MKTVFSYVLKRLPFAVIGSVFMILEVLMDLIQPRMMETIVDVGILGTDGSGQPDIGYVLSTGGHMILLVLFGGFCGIMSAVFINYMAQTSANGIRKDCFSRVMYFDHQQMDDFSSSSLITRITNDVTQVQNLFAQMFRGIVRCSMFFIGGTAALLSLDLSFSAVLAVTTPLILADIIFIVWKTNPLFTLLQKRLDAMNSVLEENVSGARVVKAFVQENREEARFERSNNDLTNTQYQVLVYLAFMRPVMNIVLNLATVAIIYIGGLQAKASLVNPGVIMAAITYISQILNGMTMMAMIFQTISRGTASAKRLEEILVTDPVLADGSYDAVTEENSAAVSEGTASDSCEVPAIRFDQVSFSYPGTRREILHDINLTVHQGETVAIIGSTGCGKSTLVNLIPRFYDATAGTVFVDGRDVRTYSKAALREKVTICLQKSELFHGTILDNIILNTIPDETDRPDKSRKGAAASGSSVSSNGEDQKKSDPVTPEIRAAAEDAQAIDFIMKQPEGFLTQVAQGGMSLSGGQKQRVAIARALLRRSEILILDDSTSALDLKTEAQLYAALRNHYQDMTMVIIAQRIATARQADRIAVLENGTLIACDTHENLLKTCKVYRDICESQMSASEYGGAE